MTEPSGRPTILVLLGCFRAGLEATGPNQSMIGMASALEQRFRFRVIGVEPEPRSSGWTILSGVEQLALAERPFGARGLREAIASTPHDLMVLNGFFDRNLSIPALTMRRLGLIPRRPALLAPRGEFSPGALALKSGKKGTYLRLARSAGLLRDVSFQATTEEEAQRIREGFGTGNPVLVGPNVRVVPPLPASRPRQPGEALRIAFLGRITPIKNLDFALEVLARFGGAAQFDIFGPADDPAYWLECQRLAAAMPAAVRVRHCGILPQAEVVDRMAGYDLMFLPTGGENFGHAIFEALAAGTPVLISDQTPWHELQARSAGWNLPLGRPDLFVDALRSADGWSKAQSEAFRAGARAVAEHAFSEGAAVAQLAHCLEAAMGRPLRARSAGPRS